MKLKVPRKNYNITELYDAVAMAMGYGDVSNLLYDCREINIAQNIQDGIYEKYMDAAREDQMTESDARVGITMLLAISGPKVDENLADDEVEVFDGFIC